MKLFAATAAAALVSTAALADESTRYNDLRLDTTENAETVFSDAPRSTDLDGAQRGRDQILSTADDSYDADVTFSTRSAIRTPGEGYPYGGFGKGNDSR